MCDKNNGDSPVVDVAARFILAHCTDDKDWLQEEILFTHNSFYLRCFFDLYLHTTGHYYNFSSRFFQTIKYKVHLNLDYGHYVKKNQGFSSKMQLLRRNFVTVLNLNI